MAAAAEAAAVSVVNGASRAGKRPALVVGRAGLPRGTSMETFKKRQKEMRRLERQRDKAAKRKEAKARKAAGITSESDRDTEATENAAADDAATDLSTRD